MHFVPAGGLGNQAALKVLALKLGHSHHCSRIKGKIDKNGHRVLQSCAWANVSPGGTHPQSTPPLEGECPLLGRSSEHTLSGVGWIWHLHNFKCSS